VMRASAGGSGGMERPLLEVLTFLPAYHIATHEEPLHKIITRSFATEIASPEENAEKGRCAGRKMAPLCSWGNAVRER
jgi:hypothetical protein